MYIDIEADNLLRDAKTIWCIVAKEKGEYFIYLKHPLEGLDVKGTIYYNVEEFISQVVFDKVLVAHNGISYDFPLLDKLCGFKYDVNKVVDTHILSRLYNPDREGHSLGWWGTSLRFGKGDYNDWSKLTKEMVEYCIRDVDLLERVHLALQEEAAGWDWSEAIKLENNIWHVQMKQELHGVSFDKEKAEELFVKISREVEELSTTIISQIPMMYKDEGEVKKVFNKDGSYTKSVKLWLERNENE